MLVLHNLSVQERTGFDLNTNQSDLPAGNYTLRSQEDATELGSLSVESNGSFSISLSALTLLGQQSLIVSLHSS